MITTILLTLTALYLYEHEVYSRIERSYPMIFKLNFKPFNCMFCLSFWSGLILTLITLEPIYMAMPLFYKLTQKQ